MGAPNIALYQNHTLVLIIDLATIMMMAMMMLMMVMMMLKMMLMMMTTTRMPGWLCMMYDRSGSVEKIKRL